MSPEQQERNETARAIRSIRKTIRSSTRKPLLNIEVEQCEPKVTVFEKILAYSLIAIITISFWAIIFFLCFRSTTAHAYTEQQAIQTIIGEASNQGLVGMVAVGEVIRNTGTIKGMYGYLSPHVAKEPRWVWRQAKQAWLLSSTSNHTHGANHFENIRAFGTPYWAKDCVVTLRYKDHVFMKEVSR